MEQVNHLINYNRKARKVALWTQTHSSHDVPTGYNVIAKNADSFLHDIVTLFKKHPQDGLIGALIQVAAMKMKGHKNALARCCNNFFVEPQSLSSSVFDSVSALTWTMLTDYSVLECKGREHLNDLYQGS